MLTFFKTSLRNRGLKFLSLTNFFVINILFKSRTLNIYTNGVNWCHCSPITIGIRLYHEWTNGGTWLFIANSIFFYFYINCKTWFFLRPLLLEEKCTQKGVWGTNGCACSMCKCDSWGGHCLPSFKLEIWTIRKTSPWIIAKPLTVFELLGLPDRFTTPVLNILGYFISFSR